MDNKGLKIRKAVLGEDYVANHDGFRSARDVFAEIDRA